MRTTAASSSEERRTKDVEEQEDGTEGRWCRTCCGGDACRAFILGGCASTVNEETLKATEEVKVGPQAAPFRTITSFSQALRCMDNHMITFGVRDVSVLVEELTDQTKKVSAGTRDMLISAVSEMTKRSRAIKLVAYGQDSNNVIGFLQQAERKSAYSLIPQFDIKGSISQFDESVAKKDASFGVSLGEIFSYGGRTPARRRYSRRSYGARHGRSVRCTWRYIAQRRGHLQARQGCRLGCAVSQVRHQLQHRPGQVRRQWQALRNLIELS
jgi:hypothetical protein